MTSSFDRSAISLRAPSHDAKLSPKRVYDELDRRLAELARILHARDETDILARTHTEARINELDARSSQSLQVANEVRQQQMHIQSSRDGHMHALQDALDILRDDQEVFRQDFVRRLAELEHSLEEPSQQEPLRKTRGLRASSIRASGRMSGSGATSGVPTNRREGEFAGSGVAPERISLAKDRASSGRRHIATTPRLPTEQQRIANFSERNIMSRRSSRSDSRRQPPGGDAGSVAITLRQSEGESRSDASEPIIESWVHLGSGPDPETLWKMHAECIELKMEGLQSGERILEAEEWQCARSDRASAALAASIEECQVSAAEELAACLRSIRGDMSSAGSEALLASVSVRADVGAEVAEAAAAASAAQAEAILAYTSCNNVATSMAEQSESLKACHTALARDVDEFCRKISFIRQEACDEARRGLEEHTVQHTSYQLSTCKELTELRSMVDHAHLSGDTVKALMDAQHHKQLQGLRDELAQEKTARLEASYEASEVASSVGVLSSELKAFELGMQKDREACDLRAMAKHEVCEAFDDKFTEAFESWQVSVLKPSWQADVAQAVQDVGAEVTEAAAAASALQAEAVVAYTSFNEAATSMAELSESHKACYTALARDVNESFRQISCIRQEACAEARRGLEEQTEQHASCALSTCEELAELRSMVDHAKSSGDIANALMDAQHHTHLKGLRAELAEEKSARLEASCEASEVSSSLRFLSSELQEFKIAMQEDRAACDLRAIAKYEVCEAFAEKFSEAADSWQVSVLQPSWQADLAQAVQDVGAEVTEAAAAASAAQAEAILAYTSRDEAATGMAGHIESLKACHTALARDVGEACTQIGFIRQEVCDEARRGLEEHTEQHTMYQLSTCKELTELRSMVDHAQSFGDTVKALMDAQHHAHLEWLRAELSQEKTARHQASYEASEVASSVWILSSELKEFDLAMQKETNREACDFSAIAKHQVREAFADNFSEAAESWQVSALKPRWQADLSQAVQEMLAETESMHVAANLDLRYARQDDLERTARSQENAQQQHDTVASALQEASIEFQTLQVAATFDMRRDWQLDLEQGLANAQDEVHTLHCEAVELALAAHEGVEELKKHRCSRHAAIESTGLQIMQREFKELQNDMKQVSAKTLVEARAEACTQISFIRQEVCDEARRGLEEHTEQHTMYQLSTCKELTELRSMFDHAQSFGDTVKALMDAQHHTHLEWLRAELSQEKTARHQASYEASEVASSVGILSCELKEFKLAMQKETNREACDLSAIAKHEVCEAFADKFSEAAESWQVSVLKPSWQADLCQAVQEMLAETESMHVAANLDLRYARQGDLERTARSQETAQQQHDTVASALQAASIEFQTLQVAATFDMRRDWQLALEQGLANAQDEVHTLHCEAVELGRAAHEGVEDLKKRMCSRHAAIESPGLQLMQREFKELQNNMKQVSAETLVEARAEARMEAREARGSDPLDLRRALRREWRADVAFTREESSAETRALFAELQVKACAEAKVEFEACASLATRAAERAQPAMASELRDMLLEEQSQHIAESVQLMSIPFRTENKVWADELLSNLEELAESATISLQEQASLTEATWAVRGDSVVRHVDESLAALLQRLGYDDRVGGGNAARSRSPDGRVVDDRRPSISPADCPPTSRPVSSSSTPVVAQGSLCAISRAHRGLCASPGLLAQDVVLRTPRRVLIPSGITNL